MTEETAAAPGKAPKKRAPRSKKPGTPISKLIVEAVAANKSRKGTSIQAVKKFLITKGVDVFKMNSHINLAVVRLVKKGDLKQLRGVGASGSFMLAKKTIEAKPARKTKTSSKPRKPKTPKTPKRPSTKKTTKKSPAKKTTAKKTTGKKTTKKSPAKKTSANKTSAKKTPTKKTPTKKTPTKKTTTRKPAVKRSIKPKTGGSRKATATKRSGAKK